ncbi:hypothetical protein B0J17DRAFT_714319 [Rhizoctonia solani]|nr:hypothetical protein B0J17DRAFT_714319 [Rhizoctonia solani]
MPNASKSQPYDPTALQWVSFLIIIQNATRLTLYFQVHGQDLTDVRAPTGQIISGVACLLIPEGHLDKVAVDWLVAEFRAGPGRNAKKAICHKCYDERNHVLWDPKPASLKRHLYHHYQIKCAFGEVERDPV